MRNVDLSNVSERSNLQPLLYGLPVFDTIGVPKANQLGICRLHILTQEEGIL
jgi:hypothetical protein